MKKLLSIGLALLSTNSFASMTYYSDGSWAQTNGSYTYYSDGTWSNHY